MKFRDFLRILTSRGYALDRESGSHRVYKGMVSGKTRFVVVGTCDQQFTDGIRQELDTHSEGSCPLKQSRTLTLGQIRDGLEIERDRRAEGG